MNLWTYKRRFSVGGVQGQAHTSYDFKRMTSRLYLDGALVASDTTEYWRPDGQRNHVLRAQLADGRLLEVEAGWINAVSIGIAVRVGGALAHESHPGKRIGWPEWAKAPVPANDPQAQEKAEREKAQWNRNKYSVFVDIALGLLFFAVAKLTDLTTAALIGAAAGLALLVVQRFVKVDLLGGLAMFGIFMLLVSAGFSLAFQNDWAVQMKSTVLGLFVATLMLTDAFANRGHYFGGRLQRYLMVPIDLRRFTLGLGLVGLLMAGLNYAVAEFFSKDTWLYYTTFGDIVLTIALFFAVMRFAKIPA
ncbi:MAG: septation protein IspZ [Burkholderiaceae bacterium]